MARHEDHADGMEAGFERLSKELAQRDRALLLAILGMIVLAVAILKFV